MIPSADQHYGAIKIAGVKQSWIFHRAEMIDELKIGDSVSFTPSDVLLDSDGTYRQLPESLLSQFRAEGYEPAVTILRCSPEVVADGK